MKKIILVLTMALLICLTFVSCGFLSSEEVAMVQNGTLNSYPNKTFGKAIDGFVGSPKWESILNDDGYTYVNIKGNIEYLDKEIEMLLQFKIIGDTFEYNALEFNGIPQDNLMYFALIEAMYEEDTTVAENEEYDYSQQVVFSKGNFYGNAIFGYSIEVPQYFDKGEESDNNDGLVFYGDDIEIAVWGHYSEANIKSMFLESKGYQDSVSYEKLANNMFILSGINYDGNIYYQKTIKSKTDGMIYATVNFNYKKSKQVEIDKILVTILDSFKF